MSHESLNFCWNDKTLGKKNSGRKVTNPRNVLIFSHLQLLVFLRYKWGTNGVRILLGFIGLG